MNKIEIKNLDLYYGNFHALKNINLEIPENQITAFIGPSGCGKSTLLKSINRMNDMVEGCRIEGEILLQQQPMATDLRLITAALKMITDMKRIGDHAVDVADLVQKIRETSEGETILDYLLIAKYIERIGNHATNIGEWVIFALTGERE